MDDGEIPEWLRLTEVGDQRYSVVNHGDPETHRVVFGGQLLAQMIMAATACSDAKTVKTINTVFARAGRIDAATEIVVETIHAGRAFASHSVTAVQGDRLCARSLVLAHTVEDDLIHHQLDTDVPDPPAADDPTIVVGGLAFPGAEYSLRGVDVLDSAAPSRPARLDVWYRSPSTPADPAVTQAVLAWATDGFCIATAMLPHEGVGQDRAHVDISTGVVDHTLTFHRPFSLDDWVVLRHQSPFAGGGRSYGRADVFTADGTLVAGFVQDNMIRPMPQQSSGAL